MKTVTMLEFRSRAEAVLEQVRKGQAFVLTYRGKPVARLEPIDPAADAADDPIYRLADLASEKCEPLSNDAIDRVLYGE